MAGWTHLHAVVNIETLADHIEEFKAQVIASGFKRDVQDYVESLPNNQSNAVILREIASKTLNHLERIYASDLPEALSHLLPREKVKPSQRPIFGNTE